MLGKCFCCNLPSIGTVKDQPACSLCIVTFCQPDNYQSEHCARCKSQEAKVQSSACSCGYIGMTQPCCPQCQFSRPGDYIAAFQPGDEATWKCEKCGLEDIMTPFCPRCVQEFPDGFQSFELAKPGRYTFTPPQASEDEILIDHSAELWKCICGYEYNNAVFCQKCGLEAGSVPPEPPTAPLKPQTTPLPVWQCPECALHNNPDCPACLQCSCPQGASSPCTVCKAFNLADSQLCHKCQSPRFPPPPVPSCPTCNTPLPDPSLPCPACSSPSKPVGKKKLSLFKRIRGLF